MDEKIYGEASQVAAENGSVEIDGPDGVDVTLTPEAAIETSDRLVYAAEKAKTQQIVRGKRKPL